MAWNRGNFVQHVSHPPSRRRRFRRLRPVNGAGYDSQGRRLPDEAHDSSLENAPSEDGSDDCEDGNS